MSTHEEIKDSLTNALEKTSLKRLAQMQGQRYWFERSFQDGKSQAGLDHYQASGWKAWHHHMALVMMAMLFMLQERIVCAVRHPRLFAAVGFQTENHVIVNNGYRAADFAPVSMRTQA